MSKPRVLIAGASIAGPTAAYWFAKAGARVTVIERFPSLRVNGQAVDIRTAGVTVMRKMPGMEAAVRAKRPPIEGISFVSDKGHPYGVIRATGNPDQQSLLSEYEISRGDLSQILFDMTKDIENIEYHFGEQIVSIQQDGGDDGAALVGFANGLPTSEYDLVVACDGATSRTRAIGLGDDIQDFIKPMNGFAAFFSIQEDICKGRGNIGQAYSAIPGRFIAAGRDPSGLTRVVLMGFHPRHKRDATLPFREALQQGDDAVKQFLTNYYRGAGWKTDEILEGIMEAEDFYANEIAQVKLPTLHKGRFVLVGDAGYGPGPTGTGTTLAMVGAYLLAGEIGKHKGDLAAGLKGYEEHMRPIIDEMQKVPLLFPAFLAPQTAWGLWLRNTVFAFFARTRILEFAQRFFGAGFAHSSEYKLPEYERLPNNGKKQGTTHSTQ